MKPVWLGTWFIIRFVLTVCSYIWYVCERQPRSLFLNWMRRRRCGFCFAHTGVCAARINGHYIIKPVRVNVNKVEQYFVKVSRTQKILKAQNHSHRWIVIFLDMPGCVFVCTCMFYSVYMYMWSTFWMVAAIKFPSLFQSVIFHDNDSRKPKKQQTTTTNINS